MTSRPDLGITERECCAKAALVDDYAAEIARLRADNDKLRERLGPLGLEVIEIDGAGHYVNVKVKAEIESLRAEVERLRWTLKLIEFDVRGRCTCCFGWDGKFENNYKHSKECYVRAALAPNGEQSGK